MTTISLHQQDLSGSLYRRFALLVSSYFEHPAEAQKPGAAVPLENLFRLLQMYRYNAFADERRSGVLAIDSIGEQPMFNANEENWYAEIQLAVDAALASTFQGVPKEEAIPQVQSALTWLALDKNAPPVEAVVRHRAKAFLDQLSVRLT